MSKGLEGTFALNKGEAIHRWYAYVEGYSDSLVENELKRIGYDKVQTLYDPFGGSGTSLLTASKHGITPYFTEINPAMSFICEVKINSVKRIKESKEKQSMLRMHKDQVVAKRYRAKTKVDYQGFEKFYEPEKLSVLLQIMSDIQSINDDDVKDVCRVAAASIAVQVSKMIRRGDLRYAKENEKKNVNQNVKEVYLDKLGQIISDIEDADVKLFTEVTKLSDDARNIDSENLFDCVITSPPYLNGTNYIRNTKLELKLLGFVETEDDLPKLHSKGIIAGINNVSKRSIVEELPIVQPILEELKPVAYDKRIPIMVAGYFYDMDKVIQKLSVAIKPQGIFIMDIGDSIFSGIHIPTHELLEKLAIAHGFTKMDEDILRVRHSNNGKALSQRVLRFVNNKR